ncbi:MAG: hypothetical protein AAGI01_11010, partial [Myxococcota bacterium]
EGGSHVPIIRCPAPMLTFSIIVLALTCAGLYIAGRHSVVITPMGARTPRALIVHDASGASDSTQRREVRIPLDFHAAFDACDEAVRSIPNAALRQLSRDEGLIVARVDMTHFRPGERIEMRLIPLDAHDTFVTIIAEPAFGIALLDPGPARRHADAVVHALEQMLEAPRFLE